ncbi:VQ motif-containing protein 9-like [Pistacia vera]|uniref:VQ motif-containing protein 9-like n=1 Tax=Pistacia vera TaxID=55513 RepID=UPI001263700C|nr:VQ motif-containing protein 9-like [Pistacia vera]
MDKICHSSGDSTTTTSNFSSSITNNRDLYLKQLNKLSHKISKPNTNTTTNAAITTNNPIVKKPTPTFDQNQNQPPQPQHQQNLQHQHQHQPPVYNINKNDFRDVVQKLTGSPAHERFSTPPPIHQPKPPSSRLQRIRPPPLVHVSNRPPPMLPCAPPPIPPPNPTATTNNTSNNNFIPRSTAPLSPLPPFPAVHAAAESPVTAYMRYLKNSISTADPNSKPQFSGFSPLAPLVSPRWNNLTDTSQQQGIIPPPTAQAQPQFQLPTSPLAFGCLNSPRSPYPFSPSLLLSPTSGQLNFPLSPTVPVPSPTGRGL